MGKGGWGGDWGSSGWGMGGWGGGWGGPYGCGGWGDFGGMKGMGYGAAKGSGKKGGKQHEETDVTARYLLGDLAEHITEGNLRDYFGAYGDIENVTVKAIAGGLNGGSKIIGSVKFATPTLELRDIMFKEKHEINGCQISVQTWKMQKLQRPGYAAKLAEEKAAKEAKEDEDKDVTARYLLCDLADGTTEGNLREYFGALGEIEEATVKALAGGAKLMGSVKFKNPTVPLKEIMFTEKHEINGCQISVQTWKTQKLKGKGGNGKGGTQRISPY